MKLLLTGGLGYIGAHTMVELLAAGHSVLVLDDLSNSRPSVAERVRRITGRAFEFLRADLRERKTVEAVFAQRRIDAVLHFAGKKAVAESIAQPLRYYDNNVAGSLVLFEAMARHGVRNIVFSSSATVYGQPRSLPIREDAPLSVQHPYGRSKLMLEEILRDLALAEGGWRIILLRYFNPVGAHESGLIGEEPQGIPANLLPYIAQVADGRRDCLSIYGGDYPTPDGTGLRDYIHVVDLAAGHVRALDKLAASPGVHTYNLGTGRPYSVLDMVRAFEEASGRTVPYRIVERRPGDVASCFADPSLARRELGWCAERGIEAMCQDTWRYQSFTY